MKLKAFKTLKTYGILLITLSFLCTVGITQPNTESAPTNQPKNNDTAQEAQALDAFLDGSEYKLKPTDQKLACILATCFCNFNIKGHFSKFVKTLISFLENPEHIAQLKSKFPSLNIIAIIAALKKVETDTSAAQIVLKLRNYISLFPEEFANILPEELIKMNALVFRSRISQRLQDKA